MGDISRNFNRSDFTCNCSKCSEKPDSPATKLEVINDLQDMRDFLGEPLIVIRGVSCEEHNEAVGGSDDSRHLPKYADAIDLRAHDSEQKYRIVRAAILLGKFTFIEVGTRHIHVDKRPISGKKLISGVSK